MVKLSDIDLNLFVVLAVVLAERGVTRAAKRLHVTPSAVSNSLARLRELLGDALVVRSGNDLVATARAEELSPVLTHALASLQGILDHERGFLPEETTRTFTLAAADSNQVCDVPAIIESFARELPRAVLRIVSTDYLVSSGGLATGEIDAAFAVEGMPLGAGCHAGPLYEEEGTFVVRRQHPRVKQRMTAALFNSMKHIDVQVALGRTGSGHAIAERAWRAAGLSRTVALAVPHFTAAAIAAARTDYVAALPRRVAEALAQLLPLEITRPSFAMPRVTVTLVWHQRTADDLGAQYFRKLVAKSVATPASHGQGGRAPLGVSRRRART
jgi:DNA-binding transcriptional LysR family regulator